MADLSQIPTDQLLQMLQPQGQPASVPPPAPPTPIAPQDQDWRTKLMAGPVGQAMGGAMQGVYGLDQLAYKGAGKIASLGGLYPNAVSSALENTSNDIGNQATLSDQTYAHARDAMGVTGSNVGKFAGEVASPANVLAGDVSIPAKLAPYLGKAAGLANILLKGGAYGSTAPVDPNQDYASEKAKQIALGATLSAGGHGLAKVAAPVFDPNVQTLLKGGVPLTVGQILGGTARTIEDSATSIPVVGDFVKARQRDALAGLNSAVINRSLAPIGETLPPGKTGHEAIQYAQGKLGDAYNTLLPKLSATADPQLQSDMQGIVQGAAKNYGLNQSGQQQLYDILHGQIVQKSDQGHFDGDTLKDIQSNLSFQAQRFTKSQNPDQKNLGDALFDAKSAFNDFIARQNPNEASKLQAINQGWANFARAQGAAAASKTGIFSPSELARAVKAGGTKGTNAAGTSLMQDLSSAGQAVLPSTVPDSGTVGRHLMDVGLGVLAGGGEHVATGDAGMGVLAGGATLAAGASKPVQYLLRTALTKRPYSPQTATTIGNILRNYTPSLTGAVAPALNQNSN